MPFPVTYSTLSSTTLAQEILAGYGLGEVASCKLHTANADDWGFGQIYDGYFDQRIGWLRSLETDYL